MVPLPFPSAWLICEGTSTLPGSSSYRQPAKKRKRRKGRRSFQRHGNGKSSHEISVAEREDTGLKKVSREERLDGRISRVKPHLDKAYQYVCEYESQYQESLKASNTGTSKRIPMSATMRKAMTYFENAAKDHHIDSFLYDPDIPADNSFAERLIRSIGVQRHNSLFSCSDEGATCRRLRIRSQRLPS